MKITLENITLENIILAMAEAIARHEGFYNTPKRGISTIAKRLNNPGNIRAWKNSAGQPYPTANGYVDFPTVEDGWRALRAQCRINIVKRGLTLREFFAGKRDVYYGYAPSADKNDPHAYAQAVSQRVGRTLGIEVPLDKPLKALAE